MTSINEVVQNGYCVGCGNCAHILKTKMILNEYGEYVPYLDSKIHINKNVNKICPSLHPDLDESKIATNLYKKLCNYNDQIGYFDKIYASHILEEDFRLNGSSGGMGSWILCELIKKKLIDGVILVDKNENKQNINEPFFEYKILKDVNEIKKASKSRYHVVEYSKILDLIKTKNEKYAFIGIPCMCKSIRRIQKFDNEFLDKIPFVISLICGHLKSINWTYSLAWGANILPEDLKTIDYRTKSKKINPRSYILNLVKKNNKQKFINSKKITGGKFNVGAMMLNACNYCDDVVGETADLTIGDAWLNKYKKETLGKNLIITRNIKLTEIILNAKKEQRVVIEEISSDDVIQAQRGCYNQRREGLSYRLKIKELKKEWVPKKRISSDDFKLSYLRKAIYKTRLEITKISKESFIEALNKNNYNIYKNSLIFLLLKLNILEVISRTQKIILKIFKKYEY